MYCPFCGSQKNPSAHSCPQCGMAFGPASERAPLALSLPAWEENPGAVNFFLSVRDCLLTPTRTFSHLRDSNALFNALAFALMGATAGGLFGALWQTLIQLSGIWQYLLGMLGLPSASDALNPQFGILMNLVVVLFVAPLLSAVALFAGSAVYHILLKLFGAASRGYAVTFKVYAYSHGSSALLGLIPVLGIPLSAIWSFTVLIIGLREAHRTTGFKAAAAVLLPLCLCCACLVTAIGIAFMSGLALTWLGQYAQ